MSGWYRVSDLLCHASCMLRGENKILPCLAAPLPGTGTERLQYARPVRPAKSPTGGIMSPAAAPSAFKHGSSLLDAKPLVSTCQVAGAAARRAPTKVVSEGQTGGS